MSPVNGGYYQNTVNCYFRQIYNNKKNNVKIGRPKEFLNIIQKTNKKKRKKKPIKKIKIKKRIE